MTTPFPNEERTDQPALQRLPVSNTETQATSPSCTRMSVEDIKEIEKFRLGVWIAKTSVILMGAIITVMMAAFMYISYDTGTMPDAGVVLTVFNHLKDLIVIVVDPGN